MADESFKRRLAVLIALVTLMIDHFDLFGSRQVWLHLQGREYTQPEFRIPALYRWVRHPLYIGWALAFWATPTMTVGHLLFASVLTLYMLIAIQFEERDLVNHFGDAYERYRDRVPALIPRRGLAIRGESESAPALAPTTLN